MALIGFHASHEQFAPSELLRLVQQAEDAGFNGVMSSDHFHPWSERQAQSGYAWSWLGGALQATRLPFGVISAPGWRYHPAVLAQGAATLSEMYPERLWLALGSGEAINEHFTGLAWPDKGERNARLAECVEIIRALFAGQTVTHRGRVHAIECKLYTLPRKTPLLLGAAVSAETAEWVGGWADGLLTVGAQAHAVAEVRDAFHRGGGEGKPTFVKMDLSWAPTDREARAQAHHQWRAAAIGGDVNWLLRTPAEFDQASRFVRPDDMDDVVLLSADVQKHVDAIGALIDLGVSNIYLHNVGRNQAQFVETFGTHVLPQLRR